MENGDRKKLERLKRDLKDIIENHKECKEFKDRMNCAIIEDLEELLSTFYLRDKE